MFCGVLQFKGSGSVTHAPLECSAEYHRKQESLQHCNKTVFFWVKMLKKIEK